MKLLLLLRRSLYWKPLKTFLSHSPLFLIGAVLIAAVATPCYAGTRGKSASIFDLTHSTLSIQAVTGYTYQIIANQDGTFGYDVFADGKLFIHQPTIPAMPGTKGFESKAAAESVARLVLKKLKQGEVPPTVYLEEMKKLNAI